MAFWVLLAVLAGLLEIGVIAYVFDSMGVSRRYMFGLLILSLLGSYINIPVAELPPERMMSRQIVDLYGMDYVVPVLVNKPGTIVAVNVGGALVPTLLSLYLIFKNRLYLSSLIAIGLVALAVHKMARPMPGVGIVVPYFIPPLFTAFVALIISRRHAAPLAYIAGSLGTLVGADLWNLGKIRGLGAPVASIGGAGKFDGVFLTGIVAVLLAGIVTGRNHQTVPDETTIHEDPSSENQGGGGSF